ncbi:MAG TPA: hypothetical protein VEY88_18070 [Archangium sp.]|nr:hypothetical protein [Archangium sp.]
MNRLSSRGVYCVEASCTVTIVMEAATVITVTSAAAMPMSTSRLLSGVVGT